MHSFVDENYFVHFFEALLKTQRFSEEEQLRSSILDFFKSKTDLFLDTDFISIISKLDKPVQDIVSTILLPQLTTGKNGCSISTNQVNKFRELRRAELYSRIKSPFASFWLGKDYNYDVEKYAAKNPYYFITKTNDLKLWKSMSNKSTYFVGENESRDGSGALSSWNQLIDFSQK